MAYRTPNGMNSTLPDVIIKSLCGAMGAHRRHLQLPEPTMEEVIMVTSWAEDGLAPVVDIDPMVVMRMMAGMLDVSDLVRTGQMTQQTSDFLESIAAILNTEQMVDVINGSVKVIKVADHFKEVADKFGYDYLHGLVAEDEPCYDCSQSECLLHPSRYGAGPIVPEDDIAGPDKRTRAGKFVSQLETQLFNKRLNGGK